jgi:hypothetical protein
VAHAAANRDVGRTVTVAATRDEPAGCGAERDGASVAGAATGGESPSPDRDSAADSEGEAHGPADSGRDARRGVDGTAAGGGKHEPARAEVASDELARGESGEPGNDQLGDHEPGEDGPEETRLKEKPSGGAERTDEPEPEAGAGPGGMAGGSGGNGGGAAVPRT